MVMAMPIQDDNMISKRIRAEFKASGMTILGVAETANVGYASAHRLLAGDGDVTTRTASKLCRVLGLEIRSVKRKGRSS